MEYLYENNKETQPWLFGWKCQNIYCADISNFFSVNTNVERNTKNLVSGVRSRLESHPFIINPILESIEAVSQEFVKLLDKDKIEMSELETLVDYNQARLENEIFGIERFKGTLQQDLWESYETC